jgi:putative ABC transport system ATP-binding protein
MLELKSIQKSFSNSLETIHVLDDVNLQVSAGEFIAIIGPSGSGKSTLLGIAAGLDRPTHGSVYLNGIDLSELDEDGLAEIRAKNVGFIFQNFQLLPNLTVLENVAIPLLISSEYSEREALDKATRLLEMVSMGHRANFFPQQLSGGEEQRVAIARSFVNDPKILFADEPTANLDSKNGQTVMNILREMNQEKSSTLLVITHDPQVAKLADRIFEMKDGKLWEVGGRVRKGGESKRLVAQSSTSGSKSGSVFISKTNLAKKGLKPKPKAKTKGKKRGRA